MNFVKTEKMSKKAQKEINSRKRTVWARKPETQVVPNRKARAAKYACRGKDGSSSFFLKKVKIKPSL